YGQSPRRVSCGNLSASRLAVHRVEPGHVHRKRLVPRLRVAHVVDAAAPAGGRMRTHGQAVSQVRGTLASLAPSLVSSSVRPASGLRRPSHAPRTATWCRSRARSDADLPGAPGSRSTGRMAVTGEGRHDDVPGPTAPRRASRLLIAKLLDLLRNRLRNH